MYLTEDQIKGMILGAALGDALGAPHEFSYQCKVPYTGLLEHRPFLCIPYQGKGEMAVGQVTDDTEMALTLARSIARHGLYKRDEVIMEYIHWANSKPPCMGRNTRALLRGIKTLRGYHKRMKGILALPLEQRSQSNGALMRCYPLALLDDDEAIVADVEITNPHPVAVDTNRCYLHVLRLLAAGRGGEDLLRQAYSICQTQEVKTVVEQALKRESRDIRTMKGWCLNALWVALVAVTGFNSYQEAIDWVVRHPGSDTDTNASITGALMGARLGYNRMEQEERTRTNLSILLACDTSTGDYPRPPAYLVREIESLATRLASLAHQPLFS